MPEFLMRYKTAAGETPEEARQRALKMARAVQSKAETIFTEAAGEEMEVVWECRPFEDTSGMPEFMVTLWVTDNDDKYALAIFDVQETCLSAMAEQAYDDEAVECWPQRVKGKWGQKTGKMRRT